MGVGSARKASASIVLLAILAAGCGLLAPTPARFRPPLPDAEPMPGPAVEDVVDQLTAIGFDCNFDRGGDIPPSWNCRRGNQDVSDFVDVGIRSDQTGPIQNLSVYRQLGAEGEPLDVEALDRAGTEAFRDVVALIVPEAHRPTLQVLHEGVGRNFPIDLGGGWYIGFDRNMTSRTLHIVYASD